MRCTTIVDGRRCQEEEGHDTGVGTPHLLFTDAGALPSAEVAARELSQRLGIPCTAIGVRGYSIDPHSPRVADDGDLTCVETDGTPEGAARQLEAMWGAMDEAALLPAVAREMFQRRKRVRDAILAYLAESERDWTQEATLHSTDAYGAGVVEDCKQLHDAQVAELFERIGAAL